MAKSSLFYDLQSCFELIACVLGVGSLGMAYAFAQAGPIFGGIGLIVISIFNIYSSSVLSKTLLKAHSSPNGQNIQNFADLGFAVGGIWGQIMVQFSHYATCLMLGIAFLILGGSGLLPIIFRDVWPEANANIWICIMAVTLWPVLMVQSIKEALWIMVIGSLTTFFADTIALGQSMSGNPWNSFEASVVKSESIFTVFGTFALSYGAALIIPTIQRGHPDPKRMPKNICVALGLVACFYLIIAVLGYSQYGCASPSNLLFSMNDDGWKTFAVLLMQLHIMVASSVCLNPLMYAMERQLFGMYKAPICSEDSIVTGTEIRKSEVAYDLTKTPVSASIEQKGFHLESNAAEDLLPQQKISNNDRIKSIVLRTIVLGVLVFLAMLGQSSFLDIIDFTGATTITMSCIVLPCIFYFILFRNEMGIVHKVFLWFVVISCSLIGVYTAYKKLEMIIEVASRYRLFDSAPAGSSPTAFPFCPAGYKDRH